MQIEFEATFPNIDKDKIRAVLKKAGATVIKQEFLMKRVVFDLPAGHEIEGGWLRVRDEGDKTTMSLKVVNGEKIEDQKEVYLEVNDFDQAVLLLESIGARNKAFQESKREIWNLEQVEICIDEWPFLEPFIEVEGKDEESVKSVSQKLGFEYSQALFCSVDTLYNLKYGIDKETINHTFQILFESENPFLSP